MEVGVHGLTPTEGRALVEAVAARPLTDVEWGLVQAIGERVGWHPEALRLAAIEGREMVGRGSSTNCGLGACRGTMSDGW